MMRSFPLVVAMLAAMVVPGTIEAGDHRVPTTVYLWPSGSTPGQSSYIRARVFRADTNEPLGGRSLRIFVAGVYIGTATSSNGDSELRVDVGERFPVDNGQISKTYQLGAIYDGDPWFKPSVGYANFVVVKAKPTIACPNVSGKVGHTVTLTCKMTNPNNSLPIPGRTVAFFLNGVSVGAAKTAANGVASLQVRVPTPGGNIIEVRFAGDFFYQVGSTRGVLSGTP